MEPTPPKERKPRKHVTRPFYESPKRTSADIVNEARASVRALETKRPFTPVDANRTLFDHTAKPRDGRPPSVVSFVPGTYLESRPPTGKLAPINQGLDFEQLRKKLLENVEADKVPSYQSEATSSPGDLHSSEINNNSASRHPAKAAGLNLRQSIVPFPLQSAEPTFSGSKNRILSASNPKLVTNESSRRINSGPKERTNPHESSFLKRSSSSGDLGPALRMVMSMRPPADSGVVGATDSGAVVNRDQEEDADVRDKDSLYYDENIKPLLQQIELNFLHGDVTALHVNLDVLLKALESRRMFGKQTKSHAARRRTQILKMAFSLIAVQDPSVLLKVCNLALKMEVSGKNQSTVCKMLCQVSRDKKNDSIFLEEGLIEPVLRLASSIDLSNPDNDCSVYLAGCLKFLSTNDQLLRSMVKSNGLHHIGIILEKLLKAGLSVNQMSHTLVQLSSCLGYFANVAGIEREFVNHRVLQFLLDVTALCSKDAELLVNVSRVLSKLTIHKDVAEDIAKKTANYQIIMDILKNHYRKQDIAVRLCYTLGNMASRLAGCRQGFVFDYHAIDVLVAVGQHYWKCLSEKPDQPDSAKVTVNQCDEVLVKVVRAVANFCIDERVGCSIAGNKRCLQFLVTLLESSKQIDVSGELVVNVMATVNNVSYFASADCLLTKTQERFAAVITDFLFGENLDSILEAIRVLGNLTRSKASRTVVMEKRGLEVVVALLDSSDPEMVFCACGVLMNMMVDIPARKILQSEGGVQKLVDALRDLAHTDWLLASMICKILWNYSDLLTNSVTCFGKAEAEDLILVLTDLLEPDVCLDYSLHLDVGSSTKDSLRQAWSEHFEAVGRTLLKRVEDHHTDLEPLVEEPR